MIAHEVGHHIQTVTGISDQVRRLEARASSKAEADVFSVRQELQADCFAGVWAGRTQIQLDDGDIEEALQAANAIGDDAIQQKVQGRVVPDSFTHGSSAQRQEWFARGYRAQELAACDTFSVEL